MLLRVLISACVPSAPLCPHHPARQHQTPLTELARENENVPNSRGVKKRFKFGATWRAFKGHVKFVNLESTSTR